MRELPKDRPFTRLEAMFSLTLDYDQGNEVTVLGYAELWRWSRGKVERFLAEIGVAIRYPEQTEKKQNQRGQIMIQMTSRKRADNGQIKFIDSKWLGNDASRKRADDEQKAGRSQGTTIEPNPKPIKIPSPAKTPPADSRPPRGDVDALFGDFWQAYPKKKSKGDAEKAFKTIKPDNALVAQMIQAIERAKLTHDWQKQGSQFIPYPASWLRAKAWEDEVDVSPKNKPRRSEEDFLKEMREKGLPV
jgi:hypothetical protein